FLSLFSFLFLLLTLFRAFTHRVDQGALFLFQIFLTVGASGGGTRAGAGATAADANIGQLFERTAIERHDVKIVQTSEIDSLLIESKMRIRFRIDSASDLPAASFSVIVDKDVAVVGENRHSLVFR